jgi:hypothetical protein
MTMRYAHVEPVTMRAVAECSILAAAPANPCLRLSDRVASRQLVWSTPRRPSESVRQRSRAWLYVL